MTLGQSQASGAYAATLPCAVSTPAYATSSVLPTDAGSQLSMPGLAETAAKPLHFAEILPKGVPDSLHITQVAQHIPPSVDPQPKAPKPPAEKDPLAIVSRHVVLKRCKL